MNLVNKSDPIPKAYVLGMDANGLGIARSLGRRGISVIGLDPRPGLPGMKSRFITPIECAEPTEDPDQILQVLSEQAKRNGRGILYPTSDAYVLLVSRHRDELAKDFEFNMPPEPVIETIVNKRLQYQEAERLNVPIPRTFYPSSMDEVERVITTIDYPAFIKPCYPFGWYRSFGTKGSLVNDDRELRIGFQIALSSGIESMVQEFITGPSSDMYSLATYVSKDGWMAPSCIWQKVRQSPVDFGVGCFVRTVREPRIEEMAMRFLKGVKYTGIGELEFKRDERDGEFKLIELNARSWLQNSLAARAGTDTAYLQYLDLTGKKLPELKPCLQGIRWVDLLSDIPTYWVMRERGDISTTEWIRSWMGAEVHAYGALDDLMPAMTHYEYGKGLMKTLVFLMKGEMADKVPIPLRRSR